MLELVPAPRFGLEQNWAEAFGRVLPVGAWICANKI